MKIIFSIYSTKAHFYIDRALGRSLQSCGHETILWDIKQKPIMDLLDQIGGADLLIGQTFNINEELIYALQEYPTLNFIAKASDWGTYSDNLDRQKYPVLIANQKEIDMVDKCREKTGRPEFLYVHYTPSSILKTHSHWLDRGYRVESMLNGGDIFDFVGGKYVPEFECDLSIVGGFWPYKAVTLNKWIVPLLSPSSKYRVKIFGNQGWPSIKYCGFIPDEQMKNLFASSKICLNVSEPHSQNFGHDVNDRIYKVCLSKGFCISDYVEDLTKLIPDGIVYAKTPEDFFKKIDYYIDKPDKRKNIAEKGYNNVINNHTYFHRASAIFKYLDRPDLSKQVLDKYNNEIKPKLGIL